jgi:hypothetical protein
VRDFFRHDLLRPMGKQGNPDGHIHAANDLVLECC